MNKGSNLNTQKYWWEPEKKERKKKECRQNGREEGKRNKEGKKMLRIKY